MTHYLNKMLSNLDNTPFTQNKNYINVIQNIPTYFGTNNLYFCMMIAFNFGNLIGIKCERDLIKWNSLATFQYMKLYAKDHDGKLPKTFNDLKEYEKQYEEYIDQLVKNDDKEQLQKVAQTNIKKEVMKND